MSSSGKLRLKTESRGTSLKSTKTLEPGSMAARPIMCLNCASVSTRPSTTILPSIFCAFTMRVRLMGK